MDTSNFDDFDDVPPGPKFSPGQARLLTEVSATKGMPRVPGLELGT